MKVELVLAHRGATPMCKQTTLGLGNHLEKLFDRNQGCSRGQTCWDIQRPGQEQDKLEHAIYTGQGSGQDTAWPFDPIFTSLAMLIKADVLLW